jgi:predicted DNA-binding protein
MKNEAKRTMTVSVDIPEELYSKLERRSIQIGKAVDEIVHSALHRDLRDALKQSGEF